ncbi:hypothetical protein HU200_025146 [Digitaria exilis]|uniref:Uncharacterized protein n=1 Tax=Digitaria exilis TaxID=1010633 RepID=A0A835C0M5_9POAL|nr:hypothetical protein HU200_025146 [Digitaria exilis]
MMCDHGTCYCCQTQKTQPDCYTSLHGCQKACPVCDPKCPPAAAP